MRVRPGVEWVDAPAKHFTGNGYSELLASGFPFKIEGKKVELTIPAGLEKAERDRIYTFLKQLGFDGIDKLETTYARDRNEIDILIIVA